MASQRLARQSWSAELPQLADTGALWDTAKGMDTAFTFQQTTALNLTPFQDCHLLSRDSAASSLILQGQIKAQGQHIGGHRATGTGPLSVPQPLETSETPQPGQLKGSPSCSLEPQRLQGRAAPAPFRGGASSGADPLSPRSRRQLPERPALPHGGRRQRGPGRAGSCPPPPGKVACGQEGTGASQTMPRAVTRQDGSRARATRC